MTSIGANAFTRCSALKELIVPKSVTFIGSAAFTTTNYYFTVRGYKDSYPQSYCEDNSIYYIPFVRGDADGNGKVNVRDITAVQRSLAEMDSPCLNNLADVNGDGVTNILDITAIQSALAEFDDPYNVGDYLA